MIIWLPRVLMRLRRSKRAGWMLLLLLVAFSVLGNAATFYWFDKPLKPDLTFIDALWYSIISVATIGYGDFSATSLGARLGTAFFVVAIGMSALSGLAGLLIDTMMNINFREMHGLSHPYSKNHVVIIHFPSLSQIENIIRELRDDPDYAKADIVLVNDQIDTLPFDLPNVFFVKGSPTQLETLERAGIAVAKAAIVLCSAQNDSGSDGKVASVITLIEHLNPNVKTIAECLDHRHEILFRSTHCDSIVYSNRVINNLLVQESQDHGISSLVTFLTDNGAHFNFFSATVGAEVGSPYSEIYQRFKEPSWQLISVERDHQHLLDRKNLKVQSGDQIIYIGAERRLWKDLVK